MAVFRGKELEVDYVNTKTPEQTHNKTLRSGTGPYSRVFLSFGLLCVLQATLNISLRLAFYKDPQETLNNTSKHTDLVTRLNLLIREREQLTTQLCGSEKEWTAFGHSCYFLSTEERIWNESRRDCTERGLDLVIINTREEQEFLARLASGWMWIGLTDLEVETAWRWVDGSLLTSSYWKSGEPNDVNGGEDCGMIFGQGWNDYPCGNKLAWICEKPI